MRAQWGTGAARLQSPLSQATIVAHASGRLVHEETRVTATSAELIRDRGLGELVRCRVVELADRDLPSRVARAAVHDALDGDANVDWLYELDVVTSEVVTNAVKHTPGAVRMRLELYERGVVMGVIDRGKDIDAVPVSSSPASGEAGAESTSGRGLFIIARFARELTVEPADTGKIVTVVVERPAGAC